MSLAVCVYVYYCCCCHDPFLYDFGPDRSRYSAIIRLFLCLNGSYNAPSAAVQHGGMLRCAAGLEALAEHCGVIRGSLHAKRIHWQRQEQATLRWVLHIALRLPSAVLFL